MLYYKVNSKGDQVRKNVNKADIFIAGELYTKKELEKITPLNSVFVESYFDKIELSKKQTFFFFGARFSKQFN